MRSRALPVDLHAPGGPWQDLRGDQRTVVGIDIDPIGAENPIIDEFRLIAEDGLWPLDDATVDLAVSDFVLEHVTDPQAFVRELARVPRPGGVFIARTINRHSMLAAAARMVPNHSHARVLERLQPGREERDVFRTAYQMNTRSDLDDLSRRSSTGLWRGGPDWSSTSSHGRRPGGWSDRSRRGLPMSLWMALVVFARRR